jgi:hypothetical protein
MTEAASEAVSKAASQITEIKRTLSGGESRYVCEVFERDAEWLRVIWRLPAAREVHGVLLPEGTITVGHFWRQRAYNLYHWTHPEGGTLAYYFNIGDVRSWGADEFEWDDLAVDVLATPDGRVQVLDEDELPADLAPGRRGYILAARDEVLRDLPRLIATAEGTATLVFRTLRAAGAGEPSGARAGQG